MDEGGVLKFVRTPIWERDKVDSDDTFRAKVIFCCNARGGKSAQDILVQLRLGFVFGPRHLTY